MSERSMLIIRSLDAVQCCVHRYAYLVHTYVVSILYEKRNNCDIF